jgi:hypothetical protein
MSTLMQTNPAYRAAIVELARKIIEIMKEKRCLLETNIAEQGEPA